MSVTSYYSVEGVLLGEKSTLSGRVDYLSDVLGSVTATADTSGQKVNEYRYKPYGGQLARSGSGGDPAFRWGGQWGYRQTGRNASDVYVRARHYGTDAGRWTSKDPLGYSQGTNLYGYVNGEVTQFLDPSGMQGAGGAVLYGYPPAVLPQAPGQQPPPATAPAPTAPARPLVFPKTPTPPGVCPPAWFRLLWGTLGVDLLLAGTVVIACPTPLGDEGRLDKMQRRRNCFRDNPGLKSCIATPPPPPLIPGRPFKPYRGLKEVPDCTETAMTISFKDGVNAYYRSINSPWADHVTRGDRSPGAATRDYNPEMCPDYDATKMHSLNRHFTFHLRVNQVQQKLVATVVCCRCCNLNGDVVYKIGTNEPHGG